MTHKPKSKGRVTYHAARTVGKSTLPSYSPIAFDEDQLRDLKYYVKRANDVAVEEGDSNRLELVRVEVVPV
jgi:hypothetical protein